MAMTREEASDVQARAIKVLSAEFGDTSIVFKGGSISDALTLKFEISTATPEARTAADKALWDTWCGRLHHTLTPDHFGQEFLFRGVTYQITGCNPGKPKYAISCKRGSDRKGFGFTASNVASLLSAGTPIAPAVVTTVSPADFKKMAEAFTPPPPAPEPEPAPVAKAVPGTPDASVIRGSSLPFSPVSSEIEELVPDFGSW